MRKMIECGVAAFFCLYMVSNVGLAATTADSEAHPAEEAAGPGAGPTAESLESNSVAVECPDPEPVSEEQQVDPSDLLVVATGDTEEMIICIEAIYELAGGKAPRKTLEMCVQGQTEAALEFVVQASQ